MHINQLVYISLHFTGFQKPNKCSDLTITQKTKKQKQKNKKEHPHKTKKNVEIVSKTGKMYNNALSQGEQHCLFSIISILTYNTPTYGENRLD